MFYVIEMYKIKMKEATNKKKIGFVTNLVSNKLFK